MKMVDVGAKEKTERVAVATARVRMKPSTVEIIRRNRAKKGNVLEAAKLAAIMATKRTPDVIPLCHPIALSGVDAEVTPADRAVDIRVQVKTVDRTGVEMEALMGATAAALTVYDMLKSEDRGMVIEKVQLDHKAGGRSGTWSRRGFSPAPAPARPPARAAAPRRPRPGTRRTRTAGGLPARR